MSFIEEIQETINHYKKHGVEKFRIGINEDVAKEIEQSLNTEDDNPIKQKILLGHPLKVFKNQYLNWTVETDRQ